MSISLKIIPSLDYFRHSTCQRRQINKIALPWVISTLVVGLGLFHHQQVNAQEEVVKLNFFNATSKNSKANTQERPRIAVLDFDYSSIASPWVWWLSSNVTAASNILVDKLVEGGNFVVVERSQLATILAEQDLGESGRLDASTAAAIGRILGVDLVVFSSITGFNIEEGGTRVRVPVFGFLGVGNRETVANVKLNTRLVNTSTAEIIFTSEGNGTSKQSDRAINIRGYAVDSSSRQEAQLLTTATVDAIDQVVEKINAHAITLAALPKAAPSVSALVADVAGDTVILNKGLSDGYRPGIKLSIERVSREVKDPATGKVIRQITQSIGIIEITEADAQSSVAKIVSGTGFKVGDLTKSVQ